MSPGSRVSGPTFQICQNAYIGRKKQNTIKNTSKRSKLETKHFKLYQENLEDKKIEHNLKEEEQTGNQKQVKGDDTERNIETSSQMTKQKEITLRKNDERERNTGKTKPQNVTEGSERDMHGL